MAFRFTGRLSAAALLVAVSSTAAQAQKISLNDLSKELIEEVSQRFKAEHKGKEKVEKIAIKDVTVTAIRYTPPTPKLLFLSEEIRPYANCSDTPQHVEQAITTTSRDEVTFDQRFHVTASVSMEIGASSGVVSGSVSAGVEVGMEQGQQTFKGAEKSLSQTWTNDLPPHSGYWVGPSASMATVSKLPFEIDVEVRKVKVTYDPAGKKGDQTETVDWSKKPLKATAGGTFSARLLASQPGLSQAPLTSAELDEFCGAPAIPARGVVAAKPARAPKKITMKLAHDAPVPANFTAVKGK